MKYIDLASLNKSVQSGPVFHCLYSTPTHLLIHTMGYPKCRTMVKVREIPMLRGPQSDRKWAENSGVEDSGRENVVFYRLQTSEKLVL